MREQSISFLVNLVLYHYEIIWQCFLTKLYFSGINILYQLSLLSSLLLCLFSFLYFPFSVCFCSGASFKNCLLLDFINEIWQSDLFILCEISFILLLLLVNLGLFLPYYFWFLLVQPSPVFWFFLFWFLKIEFAHVCVHLHCFPFIPLPLLLVMNLSTLFIFLNEFLKFLLHTFSLQMYYSKIILVLLPKQ